MLICLFQEDQEFVVPRARRVGEGRAGSAQIRDGGVGWCFDRNDGQEVTIRTQMILKLFRRARNKSALALEDVVIPICDG